MSHAVRLVTFTYLGKGWCVPVGQITVAGSPVDMDRRDWTQDIRHGGKQVYPLNHLASSVLFCFVLRQSHIGQASLE